MKRIIITMIVSVVISCCTDDNGISIQPNDDDIICVSGDTISVLVGEQFEISLVAWPYSGGYQWIFIERFDETKVDSVTYMTELLNPDRPLGSPVIQRWVFAATSRGKTCASMICCRPWNPLDRVSVTKYYIVFVR